MSKSIISEDISFGVNKSTEFTNVFMLGAFGWNDQEYHTCVQCNINIRERFIVKYNNSGMCQKCVITHELLVGPKYFMIIPNYEYFIENFKDVGSSQHYILEEQLYVSPNVAFEFGCKHNDIVTVRKAIQHGATISLNYIHMGTTTVPMLQLLHQYGKNYKIDAYICAVLFHNLDIENYLWPTFQHNFYKSALVALVRSACHHGDAQSAKILIDRGINVFDNSNDDVRKVYPEDNYQYQIRMVAFNPKHQIFFDTVYHPKISSLLFKEALKHQIYVPLIEMKFCTKNFLQDLFDFVDTNNDLSFNCMKKKIDGCKAVLPIIEKQQRVLNSWKNVCVLISVIRATQNSLIKNSILYLLPTIINFSNDRIGEFGIKKYRHL